MSKEDLKPIKTHERAVELGRKGGLVKSEAKSIAATYRNLIKKAKADKDDERVAVLKAMWEGKLERAALMNLARVVAELNIGAEVNEKTGITTIRGGRESIEVAKTIMSMLPNKSINLHGISGEVTVKFKEKDDK